jgi:hypothetical protein
MATSSSVDFNVTGDDVIKGAIRIVKGMGGTTAAGKSISQSQNNALEALGMMIKSWQAEGIGLWKNAELGVFLSDEGYSYNIGPTGDEASTDFVVTEIATAASSGAGSIVVDSITGISNADAIGIELDDGTLQWTTVNGAPAGSTVTLTDVLTDDVAVDNEVYAYTTIANRPLTISEGRLVRDGGTETPLIILTREEYMDLSNKTTTGKATQVYYDPQRTNGVLKVWPAADSVADYLKLTARMPVEDVDVVGNDFDFPQEWFRVLKFCLADELAYEYKMSLENRNKLTAQARRMKSTLETFDYEEGSVYFEAEDYD